MATVCGGNWENTMNIPVQKRTSNYMETPYAEIYYASYSI